MGVETASIQIFCFVLFKSDGFNRSVFEYEQHTCFELIVQSFYGNEYAEKRSARMLLEHNIV